MRLDRALTLAAVLALSVLTAAADTLLTTAVSVEGAGPDKQESKQTVWLGGGRLRQDSDEGSQIILADAKKAYFIDHQDKTYSVLPLPVDLGKLVSEAQRPILDQIVAALKMEVKVTPTEERKKFREWNARKYTVEMSGELGKLELTVWTTTELKLNASAYKDLVRDVSSMFPGASEVMAAMNRIEGISVLTETSMGDSGFKRREELVSVEEKAPPPGTYAPPPGYKEIRFDPLAKMQEQQQ